MRFKRGVVTDSAAILHSMKLCFSVANEELNPWTQDDLFPSMCGNMCTYIWKFDDLNVCHPYSCIYLERDDLGTT